MNPQPLGRLQLVMLLRDMTGRVLNGDSLEGSIEYLVPTSEDGDFPPDTFMVRGAYRVGNRDGQGGVRTIGIAREEA